MANTQMNRFCVLAVLDGPSSRQIRTPAMMIRCGTPQHVESADVLPNARVAA